ncbi:hypothetical protein LG302_02575 [Halomonas organivorans]
MTTANATGQKRPVRVFLAIKDHSDLLVQAGTHQLTASTMSELLIQDGLRRLERGDFAALGLGTDEPASQGSGSV